MNERFLIDTNILIYAHDGSDLVKQKKAIELLDALALSMRGYLSTQVLGEFFWVSTRKISPPLTFDEARAQIERFAQSFHVIDINILIILEALQGVRTHQLPFWDAQIWAAAKLNQISTILSEDFSNGAFYDGICCINPFAVGFQISRFGQ
jgi:predicted nucleic acid-binding protein